MKKILAFSALIASIGFGGLTVEAKAAGSSDSAPVSTTTTAATAGEQQVRVQIGRGRNQRNRSYRSRVRTVTQTRTVRRGRQLYRETYQIRYLPNGRTQTRLISRVRIR